jgi:hypothetical protein
METDNQFCGPIDVEIIRKKTGGEKILLNNFDVSMITTKYEIVSTPGGLKSLTVTIPIGHITIRDE